MVDFGIVEDGAPVERNIQVYNVGGGSLQSEILAEGGWIEVSTEGTKLAPQAMFTRNRQTVRVVAYPDRIPPGTEAGGRLIFTFPAHYLEVPVRLRRAVQSSAIAVDPAHLRVQLTPAGSGAVKLRLTNQGPAPANVWFPAPALGGVTVVPDHFILGPGARQEITVSLEGTPAGDGELNFSLPWTVEGNPRPEIPVTAAVRKGGLLGMFGKKK
jgi:hypothetical protein